jgi:FtsP/CotA-like multicopper oxidase with cupredoxin domain
MRGASHLVCAATRYHSHSAGQRTEGLFGALIIHPAISSLSSQTTQAGHDVHDLVRPKREPDGIAGRARYISEPSESSTSPRGLGTSISVGSVEYDDEVVLMLHDWYHVDAEETLKWFQLPRSEGGEVCSSNYLVDS